MARQRSMLFRAPARGVRWTVDEAKAALEACAKSKLSAAAFAREHGFDPQRLYWWRRRGVEESPSNVTPMLFEEVELGAGGGRPDRGCESFEIELPSGCLVRVPSGFDDDALRRLIGVVRSEVGSC